MWIRGLLIIFFSIKLREWLNFKINDPSSRKAMKGEEGGVLMNKLAKISIVSTAVLALLMPVLVLGQGVGDPIVPASGPALTLDRVETLMRRVGTWLIMIAIVIAVIMIILGGIRYMTSGEDTAKAKAMIFNGIIGAAVVLAVGLILRTLAGLLTQTFFGV